MRASADRSHCAERQLMTRPTRRRPSTRLAPARMLTTAAAASSARCAGAPVFGRTPVLGVPADGEDIGPATGAATTTWWTGGDTCGVQVTVALGTHGGGD